MERISLQDSTIGRWQVGTSTFLAAPEQGARLMHWNLTLGDGTVRDLIHWPADAAMENIANVRGGNPILFPFSARSFDRGEIGYWRDPRDERLPMPKHGFARQGKFVLTHADERGFEARFEPDAEANTGYPYAYEFTVAYRFRATGFTCEFRLHNLDETPIPWSAGHHFYFGVPWSDDHTADAYAIRIPATKRRRQDTQGRLVTGPKIPLQTPLLNPDLVDTIHLGLKRGETVFGPLNHPGEIIITVDDPAKPDPATSFVTWSPGPDSPAYCVEPWMGPPNAAETKLGLHWVPPGQTGHFTVNVDAR